MNPYRLTNHILDAKKMFHVEHTVESEWSEI